LSGLIRIVLSSCFFLQTTLSPGTIFFLQFPVCFCCVSLFRFLLVRIALRSQTLDVVVFPALPPAWGYVGLCFASINLVGLNRQVFCRPLLWTAPIFLCALGFATPFLSFPDAGIYHFFFFQEPCYFFCVPSFSQHPRLFFPPFFRAVPLSSSYCFSWSKKAPDS